MNRFHLLVLFIFIALTGCKKADEIEDPKDSSFSISENNSELKGKINYAIGNENCGKLYVSAEVFTNDGRNSKVSFTLLTNGSLVSLSYGTKSTGINNSYNTPVHQPEKTFEITDFDYNKTLQTVSFNFKGEVAEFNNPNNKKLLNGSINIDSVSSVPCKSLIFEVRTVDPKFRFYSMGSGNSATKYNDRDEYYDFKFSASSNSGQWLVLNLEKNLSNYTQKETILDKSRGLNYVDYYEYIGPLIYDDYLIFNQKDWTKYETKGVMKDLHETKGDMYQYSYYTGNILLSIYKDGKLVKENVVLPFAAAPMNL